MTDETTDGRPGDTDGDASGETSGETPGGAVDTPVSDRDGRESDSELGSNEPVDPFDELGPATGERADVDDFDEIDDAFERMDVSGLGDGDVWESLDEDADAIGGASAAIADRDRTAHDHADREVDKRAYCQQCPHFSAPPEAVCTHEGTEIVEVVDVDEFRVRNCPMVSKADRAAESARDT